MLIYLLLILRLSNLDSILIKLQWPNESNGRTRVRLEVWEALDEQPMQLTVYHISRHVVQRVKQKFKEKNGD